NPGTLLPCLVALRENPPGDETRKESPRIAPVRPWLLDIWAQTSLPDSAVPPVEHWLHGKQEREEPDVEVAWRWEAQYLTAPDIDEADLRRAFEEAPVAARERLHLPVRRALEKLHEIAKQTKWANACGLLISTDGDVQRVRLADLTEKHLPHALLV